MRFLEKHWRTILDGPDSPLTKAVVPIDISEVARWYFEESEDYERPVRSQFPCLITPYPVTFLEYRIPQKWKSKAGDGWKLVRAPHGPSDFFGMLIVQEKLGERYTGSTPDEGSIINDLLANVTDANPPMWKQTAFFFAGNQQDKDACCCVESYIQADGRMLGGPLRSISQKIKGRAGNVTDTEAYDDILRTYVYPIYFALSVMPISEMRPDTQPDLEKETAKHGYSFRYLTQSLQRHPSIRRAVLFADEIWAMTDKLAYTQFLPGHDALMDQIKNHRFTIR